jgi:clan AA aspartic protease
MITGTVNSLHEVVVMLPVRDSTNQEYEIEAILDTGFTGSLTLPPALVERLGLRWRSRSSAILANGNVEEFDIHVATVNWDGAERQILIQAIENVPLLGMAMLVGYDLRARVLEGGRVEIEKVSIGSQ